MISRSADGEIIAGVGKAHRVGHGTRFIIAGRATGIGRNDRKLKQSGMAAHILDGREPLPELSNRV